MPEKELEFFDNAGDIEDLVGSRGWKLFLEVVKQHQVFLVARKDQYLRQRQYEDAKECLAMIDDEKKLLELFNEEYKKLNRKEEKDD